MVAALAATVPLSGCTGPQPPGPAPSPSIEESVEPAEPPAEPATSAPPPAPTAVPTFGPGSVVVVDRRVDAGFVELTVDAPPSTTFWVGREQATAVRCTSEMVRKSRYLARCASDHGPTLFASIAYGEFLYTFEKKLL